MSKKNVIIMGAAGRDFHNFNTYYRGNEAYNVVAFTATQIPDIEGRKYPAELAGELYPDGIPIYAEEDLVELRTRQVSEQVRLSSSAFRAGQAGSTEDRFGAGESEIAPFGLKNCIFCYFLHILPELYA